MALNIIIDFPHVGMLQEDDMKAIIDRLEELKQHYERMLAERRAWNQDISEPIFA